MAIVHVVVRFTFQRQGRNLFDVGIGGIDLCSKPHGQQRFWFVTPYSHSKLHAYKREHCFNMQAR